MSFRTNLGAVSAYGIAKKYGFVGTEEEWAVYIANASENARLAQNAALASKEILDSSNELFEQVVENANAAVRAANESTSSKNFAREYATIATTSATNAYNDAQKAKASAESIGNKAEYAKQMADKAEEHKNAAAESAEQARQSAAKIDNIDLSENESFATLQNRVEELEEHGTGGGISSDSADLLCNILTEALYGTAQVSNIEVLRQKLKEGSVIPTPTPPTDKTLVSITANYSGGEVEVNTPLTSLIGIVVTAHYDDGSSEVVTGYTLSGSIAEGSNTITVSYLGKTATFTVIGKTHTSDEPLTSVDLEFLAVERKDTEYNLNKQMAANTSVQTVTGTRETYDNVIVAERVLYSDLGVANVQRIGHLIKIHPNTNADLTWTIEYTDIRTATNWVSYDPSTNVGGLLSVDKNIVNMGASSVYFQNYLFRIAITDGTNEVVKLFKWAQ